MNGINKTKQIKTEKPRLMRRIVGPTRPHMWFERVYN